jgi:hypothetical protein
VSDRCPRCDREGCPYHALIVEVRAAGKFLTSDPRFPAAYDDCQFAAASWRTRLRAAEARCLRAEAVVEAAELVDVHCICRGPGKCAGCVLRDALTAYRALTPEYRALAALDNDKETP